MQYRLVSFLGLVCLAFSPLLKADEWNKRTVVTFNQPVEVPRVVLGPGTYVMKLVDLPSDRNVVRFMNTRENHVFATVFSIPVYRMQPADHTVLTFEERPVGSPQALKTWFYPGDLIGQEFIYPKTQLARAVAPPPATLSPRPAPAPAPEPSRTEAKPEAPAPSQPVEVAQAAPAPAPKPAETPAPEAAPAPRELPKELPKTAGDTPLIAMAGLLSVSLGWFLKSRLARG